MFEKVTTKIKSMPGGGMLLEAVGLGDKSMAQMKKIWVSLWLVIKSLKMYLM